jgi:hypothetical protein
MLWLECDEDCSDDIYCSLMDALGLDDDPDYVDEGE